jgi:hypothetical protein
MAYNSPLGSFNSDMVAQSYPLSGAAPVPAATPTYAGTITVDPTLTCFLLVKATAAVGNCTLKLTSGGSAGQVLSVMFKADAGGTRTLTFSSYFKVASATIAPTANTAITVFFESDGSNFIEESRSGAITY